MNYYYLDANVVVKYYLDEPGSTWVRQLIEAQDVIGRPAHVFFSAMITITEVSAASLALHSNLPHNLSHQRAKVEHGLGENERRRSLF